MSAERWILMVGWVVLMSTLAACAESAETPARGVDEVGEGEVVGSFAMMALAVEEVEGDAAMDVIAQFVAYAGPGDRWAMQALDMWSPPPLEWGVDRCELVGGVEGMGEWSKAHPPSIHLLDAGQLTVSAEQPHALQVRRVPDLMGTFSGAVYRLPRPHGLSYVPGELYTVRGEGGETVGPFEVTLQAPRAVELLAVGGQPVEAGAGEKRVATGSLAQGLQLEWGEGQPEHAVYVDVYHDGVSSQAQLSCVLADDGEFVIPGGLMEELRRRWPGVSFRVQVRRADVVDFPLAGVTWAQAVFVASDGVLLTPW
jgi:hypothetical protein